MTAPRRRAIGVKSVAAVALAAAMIALGGRRGLELGYLRHLSGGACFLVGLVASLAVGLVGVGWRFTVRSKTAIALVRGRPAVVAAGAAVHGGPPRELPAVVQRVVLLAGFASVVLGALGNHAAARIAQLPDELAAPAPSEYCMPEPPAGAATATAPAPTPPPPVEPPGCALVKRAFALGYAKTLGACAPKQAAPVVISPVTKREVCTRRQLDEPFLHYGFRRVAGAFGAATSVNPVAAAEHRAGEVRTHIDFLAGLLADIHHAITGTPHATHHLWINLPDPHPGELRDRFVGEVRCSQRFADLPLWPAWQPGDEAKLVEHVLGQLLFATRFGTTASCSDYVIHWGAARETCTRLAAAPIAGLAEAGGLAGIRAVLDRRNRQLELAALATALGRQPPPPPPAASAIVSLSCFIVDPGGAAAGRSAATGTTIAIDGDPVGLREIHVSGVRTSGAGPIEVYAQLAILLAGKGGGSTADAASASAAASPATGPEAVALAPGAASTPAAPSPATGPEAVALAGGDFLLARLDPLIDGDPFHGAGASLDRAELLEVYPFEHHLHGFIDGFRRRYLAQRGRL